MWWLRFGLYVMNAVATGIFISWLAREISYRLGHTRAWGREIAASAGTVLIVREAPRRDCADAGQVPNA